MRIPDYPDYEIFEDSRIYSYKTNKFLRFSINSDGYLVLNLRGVEQKLLLVHRLVATCFIPNPENKPFVNHLDGNKQNDHVSNLEWSTAKENTEHAIKLKLINNQGENASFSKLTDADVLFIRNSTISIYKLAERFGVSAGTIYSARHSVNWAHLPKTDIHSKKTISLLTDELKQEIIFRKVAKQSQTSICKELRLTPSVVSSFLNKKTFIDFIPIMTKNAFVIVPPEKLFFFLEWHNNAFREDWTLEKIAEENNFEIVSTHERRKEVLELSKSSPEPFSFLCLFSKGTYNQINFLHHYTHLVEKEEDIIEAWKDFNYFNELHPWK